MSSKPVSTITYITYIQDFEESDGEVVLSGFGYQCLRLAGSFGVLAIFIEGLNNDLVTISAKVAQEFKSHYRTVSTSIDSSRIKRWDLHSCSSSPSSCGWSSGEAIAGTI